MFKLSTEHIIERSRYTFKTTHEFRYLDLNTKREISLSMRSVRHYKIK